MSDSLIHGKDVLVRLGRLEVGVWNYYPVICSKSCTISRTSEVIETTSYASTAKEFTEGMYEWGVSLDGNISIEAINTGDFTPLSLLLPPGVQKLNVRFKAQNGNYRDMYGDVIVPNVSYSGDVADWSAFSMELKGTGPLSII